MYKTFYLLRKYLFALFIFNSILTYSQESLSDSSFAKIRNVAENIYGSDDRITNGEINQFIAPNIEGSPFFLRNEWISGDVFIFGVQFSNVAIKYNIESDEILFINHENNKSASTIVLSKPFIDSVRIDGHLFVNSNTLNVKNPLGFIEKLYKGEHFTSFLKHRINHVVKQTDTYQHLKYYDLRPIIYILYDDEFISLKSEQAFLDEFTAFRKDISKFIHQNKIRFKKADPNQLLKLLKYCDEISTLQKEAI